MKLTFGFIALRLINIKILLSFEIENELALKTMYCTALTMFSCKNLLANLGLLIFSIKNPR